MGRASGRWRVCVACVRFWHKRGAQPAWLEGGGGGTQHLTINPISHEHCSACAAVSGSVSASVRAMRRSARVARRLWQESFRSFGSVVPVPVASRPCFLCGRASHASPLGGAALLAHETSALPWSASCSSTCPLPRCQLQAFVARTAQQGVAAAQAALSSATLLGPGSTSPRLIAGGGSWRQGI